MAVIIDLAEVRRARMHRKFPRLWEPNSQPLLLSIDHSYKETHVTVPRGWEKNCLFGMRYSEDTKRSADTFLGVAKYRGRTWDEVWKGSKMNEPKDTMLRLLPEGGFAKGTLSFICASEGTGKSFFDSDRYEGRTEGRGSMSYPNLQEVSKRVLLNAVEPLPNKPHVRKRWDVSGAYHRRIAKKWLKRFGTYAGEPIVLSLPSNAVLKLIK